MDFIAEAQGLIRRYNEGATFRGHVRERLPLVIALAALCLIFSVVMTTGAALLLGGKYALLMLLALILAPFVLIGSLAVELFVVFSWIEARSLGAHSRFGPMPLVPWPWVAGLVGLPLLLLFFAWWHAALVLLFVAALTVAAYAFLDWQ
jgi:hypothetical protein